MLIFVFFIGVSIHRAYCTHHLCNEALSVPGYVHNVHCFLEERQEYGSKEDRSCADRVSK